MDDSRFDDFTKVFAMRSRRALLATAGSAALTALLGRGVDRTIAKKKRKRNKKKNKPCTQNCVGKVCGDTNGCGGFCTDCPPGKTCLNKQCVDDTCTPECDGKNCGDGDGCGGKCTRQQGCGANQTCVDGDCVAATCNPSCTGGQHCCYTPVFDIFACWNCCDDGDCLDAQGRTSCIDFGCSCPPEAPDFCGGTAGCVDLQNDPAHCGICHRAVCGPPGDPVCIGWECCNGAPTFIRGCVNGSGGWVECQKQHCGSCDNPCDVEGRGCCEGQCVPMLDGEEANANCGFCGASCDELTICCGGRCVNTDNDPFNCGDCGEVCAGTHACCHGECKRLGTDENCRFCDDECEAPGVCVNTLVGCIQP
jgi:hypothetical protein